MQSAHTALRFKTDGNWGRGDTGDRRKEWNQGGREGKGREKKTEGGEGVSDTLAIHVTAHMTSPGTCRLAQVTGRCLLRPPRCRSPLSEPRRPGLCFQQGPWKHVRSQGLCDFYITGGEHSPPPVFTYCHFQKACGVWGTGTGG